MIVLLVRRLKKLGRFFFYFPSSLQGTKQSRIYVILLFGRSREKRAGYHYNLLQETGKRIFVLSPTLHRHCEARSNLIFYVVINTFIWAFPSVGLYASIFLKEAQKGFSLQSLTHQRHCERRSNLIFSGLCNKIIGRLRKLTDWNITVSDSYRDFAKNR